MCGALDGVADSVRCGLPAEGRWPGTDLTGEAAGPLRRFGHCPEHALTVWRETVPPAPVDSCQHPFADQDRDREDPLSIGRRDWQRDCRAAEADQGVDVQVVAGQPDHSWNQLGQLWAPLVGGVVVNQTRHRCQQRMRAHRMIAPSLTGKVGHQLHETRALTGVAMLSGESSGSMSGKSGWIFDMTNLPGRLNGTPPVCMQPWRANMRPRSDD